MRNRFLIPALLVSGLLLGAFSQSVQACMTHAPLGRIAATASHLAQEGDPVRRLMLSNRLRADLDRVDTDLVVTLLRPDFPLFDRGWITHALDQLQLIADAGAAGQLDFVGDILSDEYVMAALDRFRLSSLRSDCPAEVSAPNAVAGYLDLRPFEGTGLAPARDGPETPSQGTRIETQLGQDERIVTSPDATTALTLAGLIAGMGYLLHRILWGKSGKKREARLFCTYETELISTPRTGFLAALRQTSGDMRHRHYRSTRIMNINSSGACLAQPSDPVHNGAVRFRIGKDWITGKIRWHNQVCFGVTVAGGLSNAQIEEALRPPIHLGPLPELPQLNIAHGLAE